MTISSFSLYESHVNKIKQIQELTRLNASATLRLLIDSVELPSVDGQKNSDAPSVQAKRIATEAK